MERNIGKKDKQIRLLFVLVVAILGELKIISNDTVASVLAVISIAFIFSMRFICSSVSDTPPV